MIIVGAKGMAKELLEILSNEYSMPDGSIVFFDNINKVEKKLYDRFEILKTFEEAAEYLSHNDNRFTLGLGNPTLRNSMADKFTSLGGIFTSIISKSAQIGSFKTTLGNGCQVMQGAIITNDVKLGIGVLLNLNSTISHDCTIGNYTEIACGVTIPGRCTVGKKVFIGSNATLNPDIVIGDNAIVGAGSVVIENVPAKATVVGNPAKIIKSNG